LRIRLSLTIAMSLFSFLATMPALAHSPYFGQKERIDHQEFGIVNFAVLYGDGIIGPDPSQVVVFDSQGYLLAATPLSTSLFISCDHSARNSNCVVYDKIRGLKFEAKKAHWARGMIIEKEGSPPRTAYPEHIGIEYGFSQRPVRFSERISIELAAIVKSPVNAVLSILWWCLAWLLLAKTIWRWKRNGWQVKPVKAASLGVGFLAITVFSAMSLAAFYAWIVAPYSKYYFALVFALGGLSSFIIMRPRQVSKDTESHL
jgi:hypothetical protein